MNMKNIKKSSVDVQGFFAKYGTYVDTKNIGISSQQYHE
jgi:hypothetical protein